MTSTIARLSALYITQGIAPGFALAALPVLLRNHGLSLQAVGLAGLLSWPWTLKFIWGPIVDRHYSARFGRRRSWIVPLQTSLAVGLLLVGLNPIESGVTAVLVAVGVMNLLASILDVVTDGFAAETLQPEERALGNTAQIGGFYLGMILGGGAFLAIEPALGWRAAFSILAVFVLMGALVGMTLREVATSPLDSQERAGWGRFFRRPGALRLLALIALLDFGENFGTAMLNPFLADSGMAQGQIGWISGTLGSMAAIAGAVLGGLLVRGGSRRPQQLALLSAVQAAAMGTYVFLAATGMVTSVSAAAAICLQFFLANTFNVALYAWIMDWTDPRQAATDFSILACAHNTTFMIAAPLAGISAQRFGHAWHFALSVVVAFVGVLAAKAVLRTMPVGAQPGSASEAR